VYLSITCIIICQVSSLDSSQPLKILPCYSPGPFHLVSKDAIYPQLPKDDDRTIDVGKLSQFVAF
jgi:hypothetical protein